MEKLFILTLNILNQSFEVLFNKAEKPSLIRINNRYAYRYENKNIHNAIIQKLVRLTSGLQVALILNHSGFIQEQAAIHRMIDEFQEDIDFLTFSVIFDDFTQVHKEYLNAFYEEEFDNPRSAIKSKQKRHTVSRKKIRAYISKERGQKGNQSKDIENSRTIHKTYSGYVHAASPHIMELYYGDPPKFHLNGNKHSPLFNSHSDDLFNIFYRSILAFCFSAKAFKEDEVFDKLFNHAQIFLEQSDIDLL